MVYEDGEGCYWVVSLPVLGGSPEATWDAIQENTVYTQDLSNNFKLNVPDTLRVGTLDSLMELSDELVRDTQAIEATCAKLRRQCLEHSTGSSSSGRDNSSSRTTNNANETDTGLLMELKNEDAEALESFCWDEAKYPSNRPLKEARERVMEGVHRCDDALKVKVSEFGSVRANLSALTRRSQGSLAVREIGTLVKEEDYVMTENLNTVMLVVPVHSKKEFIKTYEKWSNFSFITNEGRSAHISSAVPRSAKVIAEDKDYLLMRVIVFAKMVEAFKGNAREKGYQVRDFTFDASQKEEEEESLHSLKVQAREMEQQLVEWCVTAYKDILSSWMHMLTIRVFVESILRYGLPPKFQAAVIKPNKKCEVKVRAVLANHFGKHMSNHWKKGADDNTKGGPGGSNEDVFPYVSFTVNFNK